jgi:hypothetical protein
MRPMGFPPRIALVFDNELQCHPFVEHLEGRARITAASKGSDLVRLAVAKAIDVAVVGVLHRSDPHLPAALAELSRVAPRIPLVGVVEPSRPSMDEAVDLARELPFIGFVREPGPRFDYLTNRRAAGSSAPTFTPQLLDCIGRLPLFGPARSFAILQALHPSCECSIPDQARALGFSRRNLERWFQGPDLSSAAAFQSVCCAAEAAYLRLVCRLPERQVASVAGILSRDGVENPSAVPRVIRTALGAGLEELRAGGIRALVQAAEVALRTPRNPVRLPAQWGAESRYAPQFGVLAVPAEGRIVVMDPARGVEHRLDGFGMDAWPLVVQGWTFGQIVDQLIAEREETIQEVRPRLIAWLGRLLQLHLIRRHPGSAKAVNGA